MTNIVLTCGHTVNLLADEHQVLVKHENRDRTKSVSYRNVCTKCVQMYKEAGYILESDEAALEWLQKKEW